jgi:hypothetical protein
MGKRFGTEKLGRDYRTVLEIGCGDQPIDWSGERDLAYVGIDPVLRYASKSDKARVLLDNNDHVRSYELYGCSLERITEGARCDEVIMVDVLSNLRPGAQGELALDALRFKASTGDLHIVENVHPRDVALDGLVGALEEECGLVSVLRPGDTAFQEIWEPRLNRYPNREAFIIQASL